MKESIKSIKIKKLSVAFLAALMAMGLWGCSVPKEINDFKKVIDVDETEKEQDKWEDIISSIKGDDESSQEDVEIEPEDVDIPDTPEITNIMLVGVDSLEDVYTGRSDTMLLISINKEKNKVVMTSFLRDTYVNIPGRGGDRLNAANVFGGTELLKETIKANYDITVDNTILVNFFTVRSIIDSLGGIDLELTKEEIEIMNGFLVSQAETFNLEQGTDFMEEKDGTYHVNGNQALAYARIRYIGTDFARTGRQRKVINACLEKIKSQGALGAISFAKDNADRLKTDMGIMDLGNLLYTMADFNSFSVEEFTIPMDGTWKDATVDGMSVLDIDFSRNAQEWYRLVTE